MRDVRILDIFNARIQSLLIINNLTVAIKFKKTYTCAYLRVVCNGKKTPKPQVTRQKRVNLNLKNNISKI